MRIKTSPQHLAAVSACAAVFAVISANLGFGLSSADALGPDYKILLAAMMAATFAAIFMSAHLLMQKTELTNRLLYAASGSLAMVAALLIFADSASLSSMIASGALISGLVFPLSIGWILGSFYHWSAGLEAANDDVDALAQSVGRIAAQSPSETDAGHITTGRIAALVQTETAEYFDGPTQIRTSLNAAVIASVAAIFLSHVVSFFFLLGAHYRQIGNTSPKPSKLEILGLRIPDYELLSSFLGSVLESGLTFSLVFAVPVTMLVLLIHVGLKAMGKPEYLHYAVAGLITPPAIGTVLFFALPLGLQLALPFAIAMLLYRRMAGLEPLALPDDIEIRDRRTLIGIDHARRRYARVIDRS